MSWDKSYLLELKSDKSTGAMIENNTDNKYKIKVLHRGEQLFYYDIFNDRAVIVEIQIRNGSIFKNSLTQWDSGQIITDEEKENVLNRIVSYFKNYQLLDAYIR